MNNFKYINVLKSKEGKEDVFLASYDVSYSKNPDKTTRLVWIFKKYSNGWEPVKYGFEDSDVQMQVFAKQDSPVDYKQSKEKNIAIAMEAAQKVIDVFSKGDIKKTYSYFGETLKSKGSEQDFLKYIERVENTWVSKFNRTIKVQMLIMNFRKLSCISSNWQ
jgi:hypothetical protein